MRLWDWAVALFERPEVEETCLALQDFHGQSVPYLLWAGWAAVEGRSLDGQILRKGFELARGWERTATTPLREARRALKIARPGIDDDARETLRLKIKAAELESEKVLMEALEALSGPVAVAPADIGDVLEAACRIAPRTPPRELLRKLAANLAPADAPAPAPPQVAEPVAVHVEESEVMAVDTGLVTEEDVRARLEVLRGEHKELDAAVTAFSTTPLPDMIQIARLKKRKLALRDEMTRLEARLNPDIIA